MLKNHHWLFAAPLALLADLATAGDARFDYLYWDQDVSGTATTSSSQLDLEDDLGVKARAQSRIALAWQTGPGWLPDLAAAYGRIEASGRRQTTRSTSFLDLLFQAGQSTAAAEADLRDLELTLSYPLRLGENAGLSAGLTLRRLSGEVLIRDESDTAESREKIDETIPQLHLSGLARSSDWLEWSAGANYVRRDQDLAYDAQLLGSATWKSARLSAGWMIKRYRVNTASYQLDATLSGPLFGLGFVLN